MVSCFIYSINGEHYNNITYNNTSIKHINLNFRKMNIDFKITSKIMIGMMINAWVHVCQSNSSALFENNAKALFDKKEVRWKFQPFKII